MDAISASDIPGLLLLFGLPALLVGAPVIWSVCYRASFDRFMRRFRLNRFTLLTAIFLCWAVEDGLDRRWISAVILTAGALYFLWYSRRSSVPPLTTA